MLKALCFLCVYVLVHTVICECMAYKPMHVGWKIDMSDRYITSIATVGFGLHVASLTRTAMAKDDDAKMRHFVSLLMGLALGACTQ